MTFDRSRKGKFIISKLWMETFSTDLFNKIFNNVLVTKCEYLYHIAAFEYYAVSTNFRSLKEGETMPEYEIIITDNEEVIWVETAS